MDTIDRRALAATGLALGLLISGGCPGDDTTAAVTDSETSGPSLCGGQLVTCPDGSCHPPSPGVCCGFGGHCPSEDETGVDPTNITTPTTTIPPTSTLPTVTDSMSITDTLTESTTDESTSDASSSSSDGSSSTGPMGPEGCYDPLIFPYDGALCGPAGSPCVVQVDETIEGTPAARGGTPSVAVDDDCQPAVLHAETAGVQGFLAVRQAAATWDVQSTPFPMVEGGLDFDPLTGFWHAMVYEGTFDISARIYDGVWSAGDPLAGSYSVSTKAFAATGDPNLHGVVFQPGVGFFDGLYDGTWDVATALSGGATDLGAALAVAPDGTHHVTYWHNGGLQPELWWEVPGSAPEIVTSYGTGPVSPALAQEIVVTTAGGPAVPHVLAGTQTAVGDRVQVQYIRRDGADTWTSYVVASEDPTGETTCDVPPLGPGELCTLDRTTYRPLAIVASQGGDVRWLFTERHELVDYFSECTPDCNWTPLADMTTYDVHLGWLEGGVPQSVVILPDTRLVRANAEVDGLGSIHLVAYAEEIPDVAGTALTVQYVRLGP